MAERHVLISGAGIAGPALALCLDAYGYRVTVVERATALRRGGQAVDLRGAGRTVMERLGLLDRSRQVGLDQAGIAWVDAAGRVTAAMPVTAFGGEGIVSEIEILRGDLVDLLQAVTCDRVEYRFGDAVHGLVQDDRGVDVTFASGEVQRFDLVVGADGLHSAVRSAAFPADPEPVRPLGCYTAWFTAPADPDLDRWYLMHNDPRGRVASLRPGRLPEESKAALSFRTPPVVLDGIDLARQAPDRQLAEVESRTAGMGWKVPQLVAAMRHAPDFALESVAQVHLPRWSSGRVVLLGDAAHCPSPLTGLGTSVALLGAYVLGGELARAEGDHRDAFARYEAVLRPYVRRAQDLPPGGVRGYAPRGRAAIRMQAASMRWMTRWPVRTVLARQFAKAGAVQVPDYPPVVPTRRG